MSPYEVRYVDVKVIDARSLSGPVTIAVEEGVYYIGYWASSVLNHLYVNFFFSNFLQIFNSGVCCV